MQTLVLPVNPAAPQAEAIAQAADILKRGGLVAFPTETVYGLGADALDAPAVERVFAAKGRPAQNPLIVHVAAAPAARDLVTQWPENADRLAGRFWPGALTLVLPKAPRIPDIVTGGGDTVAVRVPAHAVALALLRAARLALAAPSANRSTRLSPTRAEHVLADLDGRIDLVLDAGATPGGLESTVLDLTTSPPRILRPGLLSPAQIEAVIGPILRPKVKTEDLATEHRSPGLLGRHYAPRTPMELVADHGLKRVQDLLRQGLRVGWLTWKVEEETGPVFRMVLPNEPRGYAAQLYAALHSLDAAGLDRIVVALPPDTEDWLAIRDRLQRAARE